MGAKIAKAFSDKGEVKLIHVQDIHLSLRDCIFQVVHKSLLIAMLDIIGIQTKPS